MGRPIRTAQTPARNSEQARTSDQNRPQDGTQGQQPAAEVAPGAWVDTMVDRVKQAITDEAVDATTAFVRMSFLPANTQMLTLAGLAADRLPPGEVRAVRRLWSELWWASIAVLLIPTLIQAVRMAAGRHSDVGRNQWIAWLFYPLLGAVAGRISLFAVDALVDVQNVLWRTVLTDTNPCALLYGYCDTSNMTVAGATVRMTAGLLTWVITRIPVLALGLLMALNWVYLALAAAGRTPEPMAGWFGVVARSALVQSMVGVALYLLMILRSAGNEPGPVGAFIGSLDEIGALRASVILMLDLAVLYWWLIPVFSATTDLVTLKGGRYWHPPGGLRV